MSDIYELIAKHCPDGVEFKTIAEICFITRGRVISKKDIRDDIGEYPVYSSQTENNGELGKISTYDYDGEYVSWTTDGANAGSVFYRSGKFNATNVCGLLKVKSNDVNTKYLKYILEINTEKYVNRSISNAKLMNNVMASISVPLPPLAVQQEIVRILDTFSSLTAELTAELKLRRKQYEYYRDKLLTFGDEVEWKTLGDVCVILDKLRKPIAKGKRISGQYPYYGANGIQDYVDDYIFDGDYVLIGEDGSVITDNYNPIVNWASGKIWVNNHAHIIAQKDGVLLRYLFHYLQTVDISSQVHGSIPKFTQEDLKNLLVGVPPLAVQQQIVSVLDKFDTYCNSLTEGLPKEIELRKKQYEYYRDKLLSFKEKTS